ncbi:MAG: YceD family protein [Anaerolineales bacterium]
MVAKGPLRLNAGFIVGLPVGESRDFELNISHVCLESDLILDDLVGNVRITRTAQGLLLHAVIQATTPSQCVRCLTDFTLPLEVDFTELYAFSRNGMSESGLLLPDDAQIDLSPLVREYMLLAVPIQPLCMPSCKGLCPICGANQNEVVCDHPEEEFDPRLSVLKMWLKPNETE